MKHSNTYLYGQEEVPKIPLEVIDERLRLLNANLKKELNVHYTIRDAHKCNAIYKAIEFWRKMK